MTRSIVLRLAVPALLAAALLPVAAFSQSQDSQSVADAARKAKEKKKASTKPAKVITEDDVKTVPQTAGGAQASAATSSTSAAPAAPAANATNAAAVSNNDAAGSSGAEGAKDDKDPKEVKALKAQLKQLQSDLDWLQRELRLDQDTYYSKPDYASDTTGKQKLDDETQKVNEKKQEVDSLKAKLAELLQSLGLPDTPPPAPKP